MGTLFLAIRDRYEVERDGSYYSHPLATRCQRQRRQSDESNKSLFSTGLIACRGEFTAEDGVRILTIDDETGEEKDLGRAITNYSSRISAIDQSSEEFYEIVGYAGAESIAQKQHLLLIPFGQEPSSYNLVSMTQRLVSSAEPDAPTRGGPPARRSSHRATESKHQLNFLIHLS